MRLFLTIFPLLWIVLGHIIALPVHLYRLLISPWKPPTCRYRPTCSQYFLQAILLRGPIMGPLIGILRLARCHPFGGSGYDPVPKKGWRYRGDD